MQIISKFISSDFARVFRDLNELNTYKSLELRQIIINYILIST